MLGVFRIWQVFSGLSGPLPLADIRGRSDDARAEPEIPLPVRTSRKYGQTRVTLFEAAAR